MGAGGQKSSGSEGTSPIKPRSALNPSHLILSLKYARYELSAAALA